MKSVFITGASSGIGESLAYYYAKEGATVGIAARRDDRLKAVEEKVKEYGGTPVTFQLDVSNQEACKQAADQFIDETGGIDIVIANAGVGGTDKLSSGDATAINNILSINILFLFIHSFPKFDNLLFNKVVKSIASTSGDI